MTKLYQIKTMDEIRKLGRNRRLRILCLEGNDIAKASAQLRQTCQTNLSALTMLDSTKLPRRLSSQCRPGPAIRPRMRSQERQPALRPATPPGTHASAIVDDGSISESVAGVEYASASSLSTHLQHIIKTMNMKINKLYTYHLVELDLVSRQQVRPNQHKCVQSVTAIRAGSTERDQGFSSDTDVVACSHRSSIADRETGRLR